MLEVLSLKILFLGSVTNREMVSALSGGSIAGNKMQVNILENLIKYPDVKIDVLSTLSVAAFPKDKSLYIQKNSIKIVDNLLALQIPFFNLPILKQIWQTFSMYYYANKILKEDEEYIIFSFNLFPQQGLPLTWLKKKYNCKVVSLLADLPIDDNYKRKGVIKIFRRLFDFLTRKAILGCNNLIVLNKNAINQFSPKANYIVVDGGIDSDEIPDNLIDYSRKTRRNIVYSGALTEYSGIIKLIEAMRYIEIHDVVLEIYGSGILIDEVKELAATLKNVSYKGVVDNESMRKIQSEAYLLVNPRPIEDPISQVTFPSKIFEYMVSGTAILTTKLNGFTPEYYSLMYFIDDNNIESIVNGINYIMKKDFKELNSISKKAKKFVIENKKWDLQTQRVYEFMKMI